MSESLLGTTLQSISEAVADLGHPKKILLSRADFYIFWNCINPSNRFVDEELGPTFTIIATKVYLADWPKDRSECIDLSEASEVSKRLHPKASQEQEKAMEDKRKALAARMPPNARPLVGAGRLGDGSLAKAAAASQFAKDNYAMEWTFSCGDCGHTEQRSEQTPSAIAPYQCERCGSFNLRDSRLVR